MITQDDSAGRMDRRVFFRTVGGGLVLLTLSPIHCGDNGGEVGENCDGLRTISGITDGHAHTLCTPAQDLNAPPGTGRGYTSSSVSGRDTTGYGGPSHDHVVFLTADQLAQIAAGASITVQSAESENHSHSFLIRM